MDRAPSDRLPGPRLPTAVQTVLYGLRPVPFMTWCQRRYGDVFAIRLPGATMVVLADPAHIKAVFAMGAEEFSAVSGAPMLEPFLGSRSLLLLDGEQHRRDRMLMARGLRSEAMSTYREVMVDATRRDMATWPIGRPFALHPHLQAITLDVIVRLVFGADEPDQLDEFLAVLRRWLGQAGSLLVLGPPFRHELGGLSPWGRFVRTRREVHDLLLAHIRRRRADPGLAGRHDVLSLLLQARDEDGQGLGDEELRDELMTMLAAGHDTTATALAWAFDLLLRNPGPLERLREDIATGDGRYLDATVKEVLRLRPVVQEIGRTLTRPLAVGPCTLPAGVSASPSILLAQRRADCYPDPLTFRPERFLDDRPDPLHWLPFGGGIRRCIGAPLCRHGDRGRLADRPRRGRATPGWRPRRKAPAAGRDAHASSRHAGHRGQAPPTSRLWLGWGC